MRAMTSFSARPVTGWWRTRPLDFVTVTLAASMTVFGTVIVLFLIPAIYVVVEDVQALIGRTARFLGWLAFPPRSATAPEDPEGGRPRPVAAE